MTVLTPKLHLQLRPPKSTHSTANPSSVVESSVFDQLASILLPDSEINDILNLHESLSLHKILGYLDTIVQRMTIWLEAAQMAVFTLELTLKEDGNVNAPGEVQSLIGFSFGRIEPFVSILDEVGDIVLDKLEDDVADDLIFHQEKKLATKMAIAKIQSEWANLQCFVGSVVCQLDTHQAKKELVELMEAVLLQIDDLLTTIFQVQEKRLLESTDLISCASSVSIDTASYSENDQMLIDIDHRIEPLFTNVQRIYTTMVPINPSRPPPPTDPSGTLSRMHLKIQQRWETLRTEVDMLKQELKEERWLNVFQQVADQVDVMIDGLLTAIAQCNDSIQQAQAWYQVIMSKRSGQGLSIVDRDRFKLSEKNFEAKHKCYTPAIDKMLTMLGESIVSKMTGDNATRRRHKTMVQRWSSLKDTMEVLIVKDLPEARRILSLERRPSSSSTNTMYKSREPSSLVIEKDDRYGSTSRRSSTSASSSSYQRSPSSVGSTTGGGGGGRPNSRLRPSTSESSLFSATAMRPAQRRTKTPIRPPPTGHTHDAHAGDRNRVPPNAAWLLEPPKNMPGRRTHSVDHGRPRTPVERSKTPTDAHRRSKTPVTRPKSSMGHAPHYNDPIRRPTTPSLIPRPKTPTGKLPSMIPRPHSSMQTSSPKQSSFLTVPEPSASQKQRLRKKQSMPALSTYQKRASHVPKTQARDRLRDDDNDYDKGFGFLSKDPSAVDYVPNPNDPLDVQVARMINACPIRIQCQKGPLGGGRYYFGNDLNLGGRKLYTCKLMSYTDRRTTSKSPENKVLVRVGGGWQDFEMFLLDHSNLMVTMPKMTSRPYSSIDYRN